MVRATGKRRTSAADRQRSYRRAIKHDENGSTRRLVSAFTDANEATRLAMSGVSEPFEQALVSLTEVEFEAFVLVYIEQWSTPEVLDYLQMPETAAVEVVFRARAKLRACIGRLLPGQGLNRRRAAQQSIRDLACKHVYWSAARARFEFFRSAWERDFAEVLDLLRLAWNYEPRTFVLEDGAEYTPDFFVESPLGDCFVEIHPMLAGGRFTESAAKRRRAGATIERDAGVPLVILDERAVKRMQRFLGWLR